MKTLFLLAAFAGVTLTPITQSGHGGGAMFSPDGKFLSYHDGSRSLVREIATGQTKLLSENWDWYRDQVYSADGKDLYFSAADPETKGMGIFHTPTSGGAQERIVAHAASPLLSSDGKWIAYLSSVERTVHRVIARMSAPREGRVLHTASLPVFSPDGKSVAFIRSVGGSRSLVMAELEPWVEHTVRLRGLAMGWDLPTWSPDSDSAITVVGNMENVALATVSMHSGEVREIASWRGELDGAVWPAGSDSIFVLARPKNIAVWQLWRCRLPSGEWTQVTNERLGLAPYFLRASSDGATLAVLQRVEAPRDWWDGMWESLSRAFDPQRTPDTPGGSRNDPGPLFDVALVQIHK